MKALILLFTASLFLFCSCTNNRTGRLSQATVCDLEADIASFELLEDEVDDFELVSNLPSSNGETYEVTNFAVTVVDNDITSSYIPNTRDLFSDQPTFGLVCVQGFRIGTPASGSFSFSVPVINRDQEMSEYSFSVDYDSERNNDDPVVNTSDDVIVTPLVGTDIVGTLTGLGYEVNIYTPNSGGNQNVAYTLHARILASEIFLRLQLRLIEDDS